jgi:hypothetical protein
MRMGASASGLGTRGRRIFILDAVGELIFCRGGFYSRRQRAEGRRQKVGAKKIKGFNN